MSSHVFLLYLHSTAGRVEINILIMVKNYFKLIVALIFATNVMAQNIPSYVPKDGLVGWWPFNGNANDESGNGNHGTVNGATLTTDRNGVANSAYSFDGLTNNINIPHNFKLNPQFPFSISFFGFTNQPKKNQTWISTNPYGITKGWDFMPYQNTGMNLELSIDNNWKSFNSSYIFEINKWSHCVVVFNKSNALVYVNNTLIETFIYDGGLLTYGDKLPLMFGSTVIGEHWLSGKLDDIAIYNRALSDQEVKQLYEGCTKETATSSSFNSVVYTTNTPVNLSANPSGGAFSGDAVTNNTFEPSKAKLGKNQVIYNFKNSTGCADSTNFTMILVDTLGNKCSTYDTILKINFKLTTGIKAGQLTSMNVYPNPALEILIIEANDIQALSGYKYKIVDLQGKEVYNTLATSTKTEISLKSIGAKGMYILHIVDEKGVSIENKKIVLE